MWNFEKERRMHSRHGHQREEVQTPIVYVWNDKCICLAGSDPYKQIIIKKIGSVGWSQIVTDLKTPD